jgi:hypothetical protein
VVEERHRRDGGLDQGLVDEAGAATAAGVPNPEAPSISAPNSQAMMIPCAHRSGEMLVEPCRMARMAATGPFADAPRTLAKSVPQMRAP